MQFDLLGLGIATAVIERKGRFLGIDARRLRWLGLGAAVFFVLFIRRYYLGRPGIGIWYATFGPLSLGVATAALVLTLWQRPRWLVSRFLAFAPFAHFGQISYGLYLFHPNCLGWTTQYFGKYTLPNTVAGLLVTLAVAMLSWHAFEKPINDLKNRFGYAGKPRAVKAMGVPPEARVALAEAQEVPVDNSRLGQVPRAYRRP
jgi:peptidoglycan/LPS O-acetylase OafA/YrhL